MATEDDALMKASEIMTRPAVSVSARASLQEAAQLMARQHLSGLPVVDGRDAVVGIVTEGDLLRRTELGTEAPRRGWLTTLLAPGRAAQSYIRSHAQVVSEVMTGRVVSVTPDATLAEVVALMEERSIKRLPVLEHGRLVGIVSRADLLKALAKRLSEPTPDEVSDAEIHRRLLAEIAAQAWVPRAEIRTSVKRGIVEFTGIVTDCRERTGLRVIAENIPGVKGVNDQLVWVEPMSGTVIDSPADGSRDRLDAV